MLVWRLAGGIDAPSGGLSAFKHPTLVKLPNRSEVEASFNLRP